MTGVSGGVGYKVKNKNVYIGMGFTNPFFGSYKNSAVLLCEGGGGDEAYDEADNNHPKLVTKYGFKLQTQQVPSDYTQMGVVWTLTPAQ